MSDFEQSHSERNRGKINRETRRRVSQNEINGITSELYEKESQARRLEHEKEFGRNHERIVELINEGIQDRLSAIPYDSKKYENKQEQRSYEKGFFENGNIVLLGYLGKLTSNQIQEIAKNDYISGVDLNTLLKEIKDNMDYTQGYLMASIMCEPKGKGRK